MVQLILMPEQISELETGTSVSDLNQNPPVRLGLGLGLQLASLP